MSSIKKHIVLAVLIAGISASSVAAVPVYAENTNVSSQTTAQTSTVQVFTIDKAIEYAKANSKTLAACKSAEDYQKHYQDEARLTFKNTKKAVNSAYSTGLSDINTSLVANGFVYRSAKMAYRVARRNTINQEYLLEAYVNASFYGYLAFVETEESLKEALKLAQNNYDAAKLRYEGGIISEIDLMNFEYALSKATYALNDISRQKDVKMLEFKSLINYPFDQELILSGEFTRQPISDVPLATALERSKNSITRANTEDTYALAKDKHERYHRFYSSNQAAWHSAAAEFATAELNYNNALEKEVIDITTNYNTMLKSYEELDLCDKNLAMTAKSLDAAKLQYDSGIITAAQYIAATQTYSGAKQSVTLAEVSAYMAKVDYEKLFDCVNTVFEEDDPLL